MRGAFELQTWGNYTTLPADRNPHSNTRRRRHGCSGTSDGILGSKHRQFGLEYGVQSLFRELLGPSLVDEEPGGPPDELSILDTYEYNEIGDFSGRDPTLLKKLQ